MVMVVVNFSMVVVLIRISDKFPMLMVICFGHHFFVFRSIFRVVFVCVVVAIADNQVCVISKEVSVEFSHWALII